MCDPVSMTLATVSAVSSISQGNAAKAQAYGQAAQLDYQAAVERDNAALEASRVRRAGEAARGQTLAGVVASGIKIGEGSALDAERQVMADARTDEYLTLLMGDRNARAMEASASQARRAGRAARDAGFLGAGLSLLSAGARGFGAAGLQASFSGTALGSSGFGSGLAYGNTDLGGFL